MNNFPDLFTPVKQIERGYLLYPRYLMPQNSVLIISR
jgi:hypothetical protein